MFVSRCIVFFFFLICALNVQATEFYIIKNIKISASNKSASTARNKAVENGQLKAFKSLVKHHYPGAMDKINNLDEGDIFSLIESYELSSEKRSGDLYSAKLKVRFSKKHVDDFMNNIGVYYSGGSPITQTEDEAVAEDVNKTQEIKPAVPAMVVPQQKTLNTLIIPVYLNKDGEYWFDENNKWYQFLQQKKLNTNFILPIADLEDVILLNKKVLSKNLIDLSPMLEKYNANNVAVLWLEDSLTEQDHLISLKVNYLNKYYYSWQNHNFPTISGSDLNSLFEKAYKQICDFNFIQNAEATSSYNEVSPYQLSLEYSLDKISDWVYLQKVLLDSGYVESVKIIQFTKKSYTLELMSKISKEDLGKFFQSRGFKFEERGNHYYLSRNIQNDEN